MNRPSLRYSTIAVVLRPLAAASFAALLLSTAGAFDTEAARFGPRLIYWLVIAGVSALSFQILHGRLRSQFDRLDDVWLRLCGWLVLTLPLNTLAVLGCKLLFGGTPSLAGFLTLLPGMATILAALQITLATFTAPRAGPADEFTSDAPEAHPPISDLAQLLPLPLRYSRIQAVKAEDHYVRVYTDDGQALIRLRMSEAVASMSLEHGLCPHRSWWVSSHAIVAYERDGNRSIIRLADGTVIPVSRSGKRQIGPLFRRGNA